MEGNSRTAAVSLPRIHPAAQSGMVQTSAPMPQARQLAQTSPIRTQNRWLWHGAEVDREPVRNPAAGDAWAGARPVAQAATSHAGLRGRLPLSSAVHAHAHHHASRDLPTRAPWDPSQEVLPLRSRTKLEANRRPPAIQLPGQLPAAGEQAMGRKLPSPFKLGAPASWRAPAVSTATVSLTSNPSFHAAMDRSANGGSAASSSQTSLCRSAADSDASREPALHQTCRSPSPVARRSAHHSGKSATSPFSEDASHLPLSPTAMRKQLHSRELSAPTASGMSRPPKVAIKLANQNHAAPRPERAAPAAENEPASEAATKAIESEQEVEANAQGGGEGSDAGASSADAAVVAKDVKAVDEGGDASALKTLVSEHLQSPPAGTLQQRADEALMLLRCGWDGPRPVESASECVVRSLTFCTALARLALQQGCRQGALFQALTAHFAAMARETPAVEVAAEAEEGATEGQASPTPGEDAGEDAESVSEPGSGAHARRELTQRSAEGSRPTAEDGPLRGIGGVELLMCSGAAAELRKTLRIKIEDDKDLETARRAFAECGHFLLLLKEEATARALPEDELLRVLEAGEG